MKKRQIFAAAAASLIMASAMASLPVSAAGTSYNGLISSGTPSNNAWLTDTVTDKAGTTITTHNATEFKKVLEIEDTANIPACSFDYEVTVPTANVSATYDETTKAIKTLAVFKGIGADKIGYKLENVDDTNNNFVTNSNTSYDTDGLTALTNKNGVTLTYTPQTINLPVNGLQKAVDDNVLINNVAPTKSGDVDTYYAIKTIQLDFSGCGFSEPGIYRYYIQEIGANQGIKNDYTVTNEDDNCWRTIDVYVEDATYVTNDGTGDTTNYKLRIAGYVMYVGKQTAGPAAGAATIDAPEANTMEDGLTHTNPSGNGGANGVEVASATKSEGIRNIYETSDITFKKIVTGNQASKDKFFKFNIKLTNDTTTKTNVNDNDKFIISTNSTQVVDSSWKDGTTAPNSATPYNKGTIYTANAANEYKENNTDLTYRYVTGAQLKAGYDFYLQDGQTVTIQGLPNGVGYVLKEWQDDYTPTVDLKDDDGYDNLNGGAKGTAINAPMIAIDSNINANPGNTATITDTVITDNVDATFTNERKGTIPTGVILSVAAPALVGVVVVGGIVVLTVRRKRREAEE